MLSFSERLMDENDALIDDQAALEYEYFSTVEHMRTITNNIAGVAAKCKHERDAFEQDLKGLQEQFNEQSETSPHLSSSRSVAHKAACGFHNIRCFTGKGY